MKLYPLTSKLMLQSFIWFVLLTVMSAMWLTSIVFAETEGPTKSPPYIFSGVVSINGMPIDEYLDSLELYAGYIQVDRDFGFELSAEMRFPQKITAMYTTEDPVKIDSSSRFEDLIFQPPIAQSYAMKTIYFSLNGTYSDHTESYYRDRLDDGSNQYMVLNFEDSDGDNDGLSDLAEKILGTNPYVSDSDGDSIIDGEEVIPGLDQYVTNPIDPDTDGDGILDGDETTGVGIKGYRSNPLIKDSDSDGIPDKEEVFKGIDDYVTDPLSEDTDGDSRTDLEETTPYGPSGFMSSPIDHDSDDDGATDFQEIDDGNGSVTDPGKFDSDGDGLSDYDEIYVFKTDPNRVDSDDDGIRDGDELSRAFETDPTKSDTDGDGLSDREEIDGIGSMDYDSDPRNPDSDSDGITDGEEVKTGKDGYITNPRSLDTDNDGILDGSEVDPGYNGYLTDPTNQDTDGDGISDGDEVKGSGPENYPSNPLKQDSDSDGILDSEEVVKGDDKRITNPLNVDTDGDGLHDQSEVNQGLDPSSKDTDIDFWSDGTDPLPTINNGLIYVPVILVLILCSVYQIRKRREASDELVTETRPLVLLVARENIVDTLFEQQGVIRIKQARTHVRQATKEIQTKPWPAAIVKEGADSILSALEAVELGGERRVEYLAEFTKYEGQIRRLVIQLAEEWWGFIPQDEIWRVAPDLLINGISWSQSPIDEGERHRLAQEVIDCAVARAGGVRLTSNSSMTRGYRFDAIIKRYSKEDDRE